MKETLTKILWFSVGFTDRLFSTKTVKEFVGSCKQGYHEQYKKSYDKSRYAKMGIVDAFKDGWKRGKKRKDGE